MLWGTARGPLARWLLYEAVVLHLRERCVDLISHKMRYIFSDYNQHTKSLSVHQWSVFLHMVDRKLSSEFGIFHLMVYSVVSRPLSGLIFSLEHRRKLSGDTRSR